AIPAAPSPAAALLAIQGKTERRKTAGAGAAPSVPAIHASSSRRSAAVCQRRTGSLARHLLTRTIECGRGQRLQRRERLRLFLEDRRDQTGLAGRLERTSAGQHLIKHQAQREDVASDIGLLALELLRRHVLDR